MIRRIAIVIALGLLAGCGPLTGTKPTSAQTSIRFEVNHIGPLGTGVDQASVHMTAVALGDGTTVGKYDRQVSLPWEHTILVNPGIELDVALSVVLPLEPDGLVICDVFINKIKIDTAKVINNTKAIMKQARLTCGGHVV